MHTPSGPTSLYASLKERDAHTAPKGDARKAAFADGAIDLAEESRRLGALRQALWQCIAIDPANVPSPLVDVVMAYANALRLQLTLRQQIDVAQQRDRLLQQKPSGRMP